jgi:putative hydroxymethylpyrimidine transport system ATP-binding protein
MAAPAIIFDRVSLSFAGQILFQNLSFTVEGGGCTCLLGPSGCGKSTILKMISGHSSLAYTGEIRFTGAENHGRETAWMAQDDLLLPWLKVLENVLLGARLRGEVTEQLRLKAGTLLGEAGLAEYVHALPAALSGGMRQRVALLRTLMEDRQILLMDEPFSALDALTRVRLQNLSSRLTRGATVLLVTHDPMEALRMGDCILVLGGDPVRVEAEIHLAGSPPRDAGDPEIANRYPELLNQLMAEAGP